MNFRTIWSARESSSIRRADTLKIVDPGEIRDYHAHVNYDPGDREQALLLRDEIGSRFQVVLGRMRDEPVGPHPKAMYMVEFGTQEFARLVPWLMVNHQGLSIFIHPNTGNVVEDHRDNALWINERLDVSFPEGE